VELLDKARARDWYHTIELAPGEVMEGMFDMRPYVEHYSLPERMDGMRALDVGTFDGFWAFEMERRGAEVVALDLDSEADIDFPPRRRPDPSQAKRRGEGFEIARELLGSNVERIGGSIYDATPEKLGGQFDLVLCGLVLIHLRDQVLALERIAGLCRGTFISVEAYDPVMDLLPFTASRYKADRDADVVFWEPGSRTWKRLIWSAGFDRVERRGRFKLPSTRGFSVRCVVHHASR
jgi:2-polyprenyl-3-methyl-5-hydroxy-6-metoxy-1,4-benzoquinol methylase